MKRRLLFASCAALAVAALLPGCADLSRSRSLADANVPATTIAEQVCSNCHGLSGNATSPNFPNLAGQLPAYTAAQLKGFRGQGRRDPAGFEYMWGLSRRLTDAQIEGLAAYYAQQTPRRQPVEGADVDTAAGRSLFHNGIAERSVPACMSCHGEQAQGAGSYPRLAGQHADYVVKQLLVFQRTDDRPEGSVMKVVAHGLAPAEIRQIAAYLQSLQP